MFNLNNIIPVFDQVNRKHYLGELFWEATVPELKAFKNKVKAHRKQSQFVQDLHYMPGMSVHDTIIKAINFELLKRSKWYPLYKIMLPLRIKIVSLFSGLDIQEHPYCGILYVKRKNRKTFFHITMSETLTILRVFWVEEWKFIIKTTIAAIVLVLAAATLYFRVKGKI